MVVLEHGECGGERVSHRQDVLLAEPHQHIDAFLLHRNHTHISSNELV